MDRLTVCHEDVHAQMEGARILRRQIEEIRLVDVTVLRISANQGIQTRCRSQMLDVLRGAGCCGSCAPIQDGPGELRPVPTQHIGPSLGGEQMLADGAGLGRGVKTTGIPEGVGREVG